MFNFLKKKESSTKQDTKKVQAKFTMEQQAAMFAAFTFIAGVDSDNEINPKEMQLLEQIVGILEMDMSDAAINSIRPDKVFEILNTLTKSQKEWFVIKLNDLMKVDGKINEEEINTLMAILKQISISENEFKLILMNKILKKIESAADDLNSRIL